MCVSEITGKLCKRQWNLQKQFFAPQFLGGWFNVRWVRWVVGDEKFIDGNFWNRLCCGGWMPIDVLGKRVVTFKKMGNLFDIFYDTSKMLSCAVINGYLIEF